ncbi:MULTISPECIES: hypothetical protein [unclassified Streptomyces]
MGAPGLLRRTPWVGGPAAVGVTGAVQLAWHFAAAQVVVVA